MARDDDRLAKTSRLLRREAGLRQADVSTSRFVAQEIEAGRAGRLKVDLVTAHFAALGAKASVAVWWHGAALDRLFDQAHAHIVNVTSSILLRHGFRVITEYTFNEYGERGSIDVFAAHDEHKALFVGEVKSEWGSLEATLRHQDLKSRLSPKLAEQAFGWRPRSTASVLVFPNDRTAQRIADRYRPALANYPARAREMRGWLRKPTSSLNGIWFLSNAGLSGHQESSGRITRGQTHDARSMARRLTRLPGNRADQFCVWPTVREGKPPTVRRGG